MLIQGEKEKAKADARVEAKAEGLSPLRANPRNRVSLLHLINLDSVVYED